MGKRLLIKLSGESLSGSYGKGLDFEYIEKICMRIKKCHDMGASIAIVCGGGNFLRGRDAKVMDRVTADYTGMLATVMNSLVLKDTFMRIGVDAYNQSGLLIDTIDEIDADRAKEALTQGKIVVFGGGTGKPFFSTDTGAALRAKDIDADIIVKLTNVDGVYDKDPHQYSDAIMYEKVTFEEVIEKELGVMDLSAMEICRDNNIEVVVTNIDLEDCLIKIINDEKIGTHVYNEK